MFVMFKDFLRWLRVEDEKVEDEKVVEEATQVVKEDVVVDAPVDVGEGESKFDEVCEELGIPSAVKEEGEALPVLVPVAVGGKCKGTMVNVSRDTHGKLLLEKAKSNFKSFDAVIRNAFGW